MNSNPQRALYEEDWVRRGEGVVTYPCGNLRVDRAYELAPPAHRLLDIGAGEGQVSALFRDRVGFRCAVDISRQALTRCRRWGAATLGDLESGRLPFSDGSFDLVTCLDVLEHLRDPRPVLGETARVLSPGGTALVSVPNARHILRLRSLLSGRVPVDDDGGGLYNVGHLQQFTSMTLSQLGKAAGLESIAVHGITTGGAWPWKFRLLRAILPARQQTEFLAVGILMVFRRP